MRSLRPLSRGRRAERGAALVELALVAPVFVLLLLFAVFFTDVVRVKLKLQEASRYAAWEMTSHNLTDYAEKNHDGFFNAARSSVLEEAQQRYQDLDSADQLAIGGEKFAFSFALQAATPTFEIVDQEVSLLPTEIPGLPDVGLGGSGNAVLSGAGFSTGGQVEVTVRSSITNTLIPQNFMQRSDGSFYGKSAWGDADLTNMASHNRYTLLASSWMLADGADQTVRRDRSGVHRDGTPGGLRMQVSRMKFLGGGQLLENGLINQVRDISSRFLPLPDPFGTFVVSHNYAEADSPTFVDRVCNTTKHLAPTGMHNLDVNEGLDQRDGDNDDLLRCFDTAPFRDTHVYEDSLYARIFEQRGSNFMGCKNAQADDPTWDTADHEGRESNTSGDRNKQKVACQ